MSVAGGLHRAFDHLAAVEGESLQIFTRNQRQWRPAPLTDEEVEAFRAAWAKAGPVPVASHASYLVNAASSDPETARRSEENFAEELRRCERLAIPWVVLHPGNHKGEGVALGVARTAAFLDRCIEKAEAREVTILLETTAGMGTALGARFEELRDILAAMKEPRRGAVCFDTCHVFAAGYPLDPEGGYEATLEALDDAVGLALVKVFHVNDSLGALGSRRDRHTHIGEGEIGREGFGQLVRDPRFADRPMILETPKEEDLEEDRKNLGLLRALASG